MDSTGLVKRPPLTEAFPRQKRAKAYHLPCGSHVLAHLQTEIVTKGAPPSQGECGATLPNLASARSVGLDSRTRHAVFETSHVSSHEFNAEMNAISRSSTARMYKTGLSSLFPLFNADFLTNGSCGQTVSRPSKLWLTTMSASRSARPIWACPSISSSWASSSARLYTGR